MLHRSFPALAEAGVRRYMLGQATSVLGYWTQAITLNLLLWELTHSPVALGLLNFLFYGPMLVVAPLFGSRLQPQTARRSAQRVLLAGLLVSGLLLAAALLDRLSPAGLLVAAAVLGVLGAMESPARQLMLTASLTDRSLLVNAVAMNTVVFNVGRMVGPAVAALVYAYAGPKLAFGLNMAGLTVMLVCIRGVRAVTTTGAPRGAGVRAALAFARSNPFARRFLPLLVFMGLFVSAYQTLIPVLAAQQYGSAAHYTGLFFSCAGGGSLCAALLLSSRWPPGRRALAWTPWISAAALAGIGASVWAGLAAPGFVLLGFTLTLTSTLVNATLQQSASDGLRGGMVGLYSMAFIGSTPLGHLLAGLLSSVAGPRMAFAGLAGALSLSLLVQRLWLGPFHPPEKRRLS